MKGDQHMIHHRFIITAAAAAAVVLFTAPAVTTATALTPIGSQTVTTIAEQSSGIEQVGRSPFKRRWMHRGWRGHRFGRHRFGRCWNCGYRRYGVPLYFGAGYPYAYGYPSYGGYYGYPSYGGYYGYPDYYGYYGDPNFYAHKPN